MPFIDTILLCQEEEAAKFETVSKITTSAQDPKAHVLFHDLLQSRRLLLLLLLSRFSRVPTQCNPIDGSPPGCPVPGILQARTLEWVAISFSNAWKWKVEVKSLSRIQLSVSPWTADYQAPPSMGFSRQELLEWVAIAFSETPFTTWSLILPQNPMTESMSHLES